MRQFKNRAEQMLYEPIEFNEIPIEDMTIGFRRRLRELQLKSFENGHLTKKELDDLLKEYPLPGDEGYDGD